VDPLSFLLAVLSPMAAGAALFAGLMVFERRRVARRTADAYRIAARSAGLTDVRVSLRGLADASSRLRARAGLAVLEIDTGLQVGERGQESVITIDGLADISLGKEGFGASVSKRLGASEITVGDPRFDDTLFVRGPEPLARAILDAETRRLTVQVFEGRVEVLDADTSRLLEAKVSVGGGVLRVQTVNVIASPRWLGECLRGLLDVARRLAHPADIPGRLITNARADPLPEVRLANLKTLLQELPNLPGTGRALRAAMNDPDPAVQLWAATELGEEGRPVLRQIAANGQVDEHVQARALWNLGDDLPLDDGLEVLSLALRERRLPVAEACLAALGRKGGPQAVDRLAKVLAVERGPLAVAAARALGATGDPSAEAPLAGELRRTDEGAAVACVEALGRVGTSLAVPRLRALESATKDDDLRRAAREAVAHIQERLTGATPGQLSLATGETGQVSLTEDETGRVSLPDEDT
jgi:HEAT repeat protein